MSFLANITVLSIGLGMAFPSVSITAMTDSSDDMSMLEHEFSWFGKSMTYILLFTLLPYYANFHYYCPLLSLLLLLILRNNQRIRSPKQSRRESALNR